MGKSPMVTRSLLILVLLLGIAVFFLRPSKSAESSSLSEQPSSEPIEEVETVWAPTTPFDWTLSNRRVAEVASSLALPHFSENDSTEAQITIALELIGRLEALSQATPAQMRGAGSRLADISDALTLLQRRQRLKNLSVNQAKVLSRDIRPRLFALQKLWRENPHLAKQVDDLFSRSGLLTCEHVPQLLLEWTAS